MSTKLTTGVVRLSYLKVWEPDEKDDKYSVSIIIPKSDTATIAKCNAAQEAAKKLGIATKFGGKTNGLKMIIRDGDIDRPDDEAYKNSVFINCKSKRQPGIVDLSISPILDRAELYSGCYARVQIEFFPYLSPDGTSKGVGCSFANIQKVKDGEPLGATADRPETAFGDGFAPMDEDLLG